MFTIFKVANKSDNFTRYFTVGSTPADQGVTVAVPRPPGITDTITGALNVTAGPVKTGLVTGTHCTIGVWSTMYTGVVTGGTHPVLMAVSADWWVVQHVTIALVVAVGLTRAVWGATVSTWIIPNHSVIFTSV